MYHHLFPEDSKEMKILKFHNVKNTYSILPASFEEQIRKIAKAGYWVAPICAIGKYIEERNHTLVKLHKCFNSLKIETKTSLDTNIYNQYVTLEVNIPWEKVQVINRENISIYNVENHHLLIDIIPGEAIKIRKQ